MEKFGANPSPDGAHEIDPTGEFSADYFEDFSIGLDNSSGQTYYGDTVQTALLAWAREVIPADLCPRFMQQIAYAEQNVLNGVEGLTVSKSSLFGEYELHWDASAVPSDSANFRRWVYALTNKPVDKAVSTQMEVKLDLIVETKSARKKTKKVYNVSEGQIAFNF